MTALDTLILKHGAQAFEKQVHFADIIGEAMPAWTIDIPSGKLNVGEASFLAQLLGTESDATETWLWAWSNEQSNLPESVLEIAHQMKAYGEEHQIPELTKGDTIPVDDRVSGHRFGLLACALFDGNAYFRAPYEGGALYLAIRDDNFPPDERPAIMRVMASFPQFIQNMRIFDHKTALKSYAEYHNLKTSLTREEGIVTLTAKQDGGASFTATFDARDRITQLQSTLKEDES